MINLITVARPRAATAVPAPPPKAIPATASAFQTLLPLYKAVINVVIAEPLIPVQAIFYVILA
ncbi:TPA: hypothetical protein SLA36_001691 [Staphylococcus aureus]|nr:hypothetical protein SD73_09055 [Staphylococcus aureus]MCT7997750.1 hypothetical protein [Staphylococcus aureus]MCU4251101.1 hypothetical protein [Staphylococcus aureus]MCU4256090.1 hypothetical protein [Staphylococcus aureus]OAV83464.1 hypothetical protein A3650_12945 [Staphylococcus aureus]